MQRGVPALYVAAIACKSSKFPLDFRGNLLQIKK